MRKKLIYRYRGLHRGKPIAVLGGGLNLVDDLKLLPKETIKISVNHHALSIVKCEYMAFLDNPDNHAGLLKAINDFNGITITPGNKQKYSDIAFTGCNMPPFHISSIFALWFAEYSGGSPVILCGMDLFQNKEQTHCNTNIPLAKLGNMELMTLDDHKRPWLKYKCVNSENVYVCSGPLIGIFKKRGVDK